MRCTIISSDRPTLISLKVKNKLVAFYPVILMHCDLSIKMLIKKDPRKESLDEKKKKLINIQALECLSLTVIILFDVKKSYKLFSHRNSSFYF